MHVIINQEPNVTHILRRVSFTSMTLKWKCRTYFLKDKNIFFVIKNTTMIRRILIYCRRFNLFMEVNSCVPRQRFLILLYRVLAKMVTVLMSVLFKICSGVMYTCNKLIKPSTTTILCFKMSLPRRGKMGSRNLIKSDARNPHHQKYV